MVWKKPYNVGGPVYSDDQRNNYYIALFNGLYRIDTDAARVTTMCRVSEEVVASLEYLGQLSLKDLRTSKRGDGVVFTPVGIAPPVQSGVKSEPASLLNGLSPGHYVRNG